MNQYLLSEVSDIYLILDFKMYFYSVEPINLGFSLNDDNKKTYDYLELIHWLKQYDSKDFYPTLTDEEIVRRYNKIFWEKERYPTNRINQLYNRFELYFDSYYNDEEDDFYERRDNQYTVEFLNSRYGLKYFKNINEFKKHDQKKFIEFYKKKSESIKKIGKKGNELSTHQIEEIRRKTEYSGKNLQNLKFGIKVHNWLIENGSLDSEIKNIIRVKGSLLKRMFEEIYLNEMTDKKYSKIFEAYPDIRDIENKNSRKITKLIEQVSSFNPLEELIYEFRLVFSIPLNPYSLIEDSKI